MQLKTNLNLCVHLGAKILLKYKEIEYLTGTTFSFLQSLVSFRLSLSALNSGLLTDSHVSQGRA